MAEQGCVFAVVAVGAGEGTVWRTSGGPSVVSGSEHTHVPPTNWELSKVVTSVWDTTLLRDHIRT